MLAISSLTITGVIRFSDIHFIFPPLEHSISIFSVVLVAGGYMMYLLKERTQPIRYITIGLTATVVCYLATFRWWADYITANPASSFGQTWADWLFRITAASLLSIPIYHIWRKRRTGWIRTTVLIALSFFFLDHFLMLFNLASKEVYKDVFGPIRHSLHIFAIPLLGHVYYLEERYIERRMGEELKNSEKRFRSFIEASSECINSIDCNGNILYMCPKGKILLNNKGNGLYNIKDIIPKKYSDTLNEAIEKAASGETVDFEFELNIDSKQKCIQNTLSPIIEDSGMTTTLLWVSKDITDKKILEKQLIRSQKMEAIGRLTGGIAHDFNNLLTSIIGNAELLSLQFEGDTPEYKRSNTIKVTAEHAAGMIRRMLLFSRKEVNEPTQINLNKLITEVFNMLRRVISEDITLINKLEPALFQVTADPTMVEQIIINLVINARDAMPKGGIITISTGNILLRDNESRSLGRLKPGDYVLLTVSDTGVGVPAEVKEQIFKPFFTTKKRGTGLGLATVQNIINQMNGHICFESEDGNGTTFKVYLPATGKVVEYSGEAEHIGTDQTMPHGKETILVVEDDAGIIELIADVLNNLGYNIICTSNGYEAIEKAKTCKDRIDLLLTDIILPDMNGAEVAKKLVKSNPSMRIIFMSGYSENHIKHSKFFKDNAQFLPKPFTLNELTNTIRRSLNAIDMV